MSDVTQLIDQLRLHMGDYTAPYTFSDSVMETALISAINALGRRWSYRYSATSSGTVTRSSTATFRDAAPPTIAAADERPIILQAAIILKGAQYEGHVWDIGSWRDDEVAYSNIAAAKSADSSIGRDLEELERLLKARLYGASRQSLEGYKLPGNIREGAE